MERSQENRELRVRRPAVTEFISQTTALPWPGPALKAFQDIFSLVALPHHPPPRHLSQKRVPPRAEARIASCSEQGRGDDPLPPG